MLSWMTVILEPYSYMDSSNVKIGHLFNDGEEFIYVGKNGDVITAATKEQVKYAIREMIEDEEYTNYRIVMVHPEPKRKVVTHKHIASKRAMTYLASMFMISSVFAAALVSSLAVVNVDKAIFLSLLLAASAIAYTGMIIGILRWNDEP